MVMTLGSKYRKLQSRMHRRREWRRLNRVEPRLGAALRGHCFGDAQAFGGDEEALTWAERIEQRRATLLADEHELWKIDYGAGSHAAADGQAAGGGGARVRLRVNETARASKPRRWCEMLHQLLRELRPGTCVELGTCVGISAAYQAAALKLNEHGRLITLEGDPNVAAIAGQTFDELKLDNVEQRIGTFADTLPDVLEQNRPVDFMFIDGHHDRDATVEYFEMSQPHLAPRSIVVFDDIRWSEGMSEAWESLCRHPSIRLSVDLGDMGLCMYGGESPGSDHIVFDFS